MTNREMLLHSMTTMNNEELSCCAFYSSCRVHPLQIPINSLHSITGSTKKQRKSIAGKKPTGNTP